jgi:hypothetical protein
MEYSPDTAEIIDAIESLDWDRIQDFEQDIEMSLLAPGGHEIISCALKTCDREWKTRNLLRTGTARRILMLVLESCARAKQQQELAFPCPTGLEPAIWRHDQNLALLLLWAGADPSELLKGMTINFMYLESLNHNEIAWTILFHSVLGDVPDAPTRAFTFGVPDGSMEKGIADLKLTEDQAIKLWCAMLTYNCHREAAAVALGYCRGLGHAPDNLETAMIILPFLETNIALLNGPLINYLADAGFHFTQLDHEDRELTHTLICDVIEADNEEAAIALLEAGLILQERPESRGGAITPRMTALDKASERGLFRFIRAAFRSNAANLLWQERLIVEAIVTDQWELLNSCLQGFTMDGERANQLLHGAIERNRPQCLAVLMHNRCSPAAELEDMEVHDENYGNYLLSKAIISATFELPAAEERFDCARVLLSDPTYNRYDLGLQCDYLIVDRARAGDYAAVYFLCSYGFPPILLLQSFQNEWRDDSIPDETKQALAQAVIFALDGLMCFIDTVSSWNAKSLVGEAIGSILPGASDLNQRQLISHILDWTDPLENGNQQTADMELIELLADFSDDETLGLPDGLKTSLDNTVNAICGMFKARFAVPSLMELTREALLIADDKHDWNRLRSYLPHTLPAVIWEELEDRAAGYETALWSVIALTELIEIDYLTQFFFLPAGTALDAENSSDTQNYSEESSNDSFYYARSDSDDG